MSENYVVHDWDGGVATVAFNRPDALNAFTPELLELFVDVMDTVQKSTETCCIILEGTGRAFSALHTKIFIPLRRKTPLLRQR